MRFFILVIFCVISFQAEKADAINIQSYFNAFKNGYGAKNGCDVLYVTLSSPEDRESTSVNGDDEKSYDEVVWFDSRYITFNFFPQNMQKFFPNVEDIYIVYANISTLTKLDMASVGPQLRHFDFSGNNIEVLEEGLFDENPNLDFINLSFNKIKFVASEVFEKLPKLETLGFNNNPCHSGYAANDRAAVLRLISQIKEKCQDAAEVAELKRQQLAGDKQHQEELQKHKAESSLKDEKINELEKQNEVLNKENAAMKPCDQVRDSLMIKLKELETKLDTTKDMIIKATDAKLDSTLVEPMSSLHAKLDRMDLKLDTTDEKLDSLNATCVDLDY